MNESNTAQHLISTPTQPSDEWPSVTPDSPCPYLPEKMARNEAYWADTLDSDQYERLMSKGFRRSGQVVYRPRCHACQACRQLRVCVKDFVKTSSMKRVWQRNRDVSMEACQPELTTEKFAMFCRYLDHQHDGTMNRDLHTCREFLYNSPTSTLEMSYRLGQRLIGVSIADVVPGGLSSVYMYFEPEFAARSLGTLSILREIDHCMLHELPYYYLGFFVAGAKTMAYKSRFRPNEILVAEDCWVTLRE